MIVISRREAKQQGLPRYFTGNPCKHGHISERQTSKGECIRCKQIWQSNNSDTRKAWHEANRERLRKKRNKNKEEVNRKKREWFSKVGHIRAKEYRAENAEQIRRYAKQYYERNKDRLKEYREENRARYDAHCRARQARQYKATPPWACIESISLKYKERNAMSALTGIPHHVDHVIPLNGDNVCGLHVQNNLRVIPARDNMRKKNQCIQ